MMAGSEFMTNKFWNLWLQYGYASWFGGGDPFPPNAEKYLPNFSDFLKGGMYSFAFLAFLTCHEFGHYFTAMYHRVKCSLPYYIPIFLPFSFINIGSMGAVIRLREQPDSTRKYFDIGIAGPLAGFVVSVILLWVGFATLPPLEETIFAIHPEYQQIWGRIPTEQELLDKFHNPKNPQPTLLYIGHSLLFRFFETFVADPARLPNHFEIMHYPLLFVGFITLFFTALNLLPIGQLDGGHITYGLFGRKRASFISRLTVVVLVSIGGLGMFDFPNLDLTQEGIFLLIYLAYLYAVIIKVTGEGRFAQAVMIIAGVLIVQQSLQMLLQIDRAHNVLWLLYGLIATRFIGLDHPPAMTEHRLNLPRQILGWVAIVIFIICFSPSPLKIL